MEPAGQSGLEVEKMEPGDTPDRRGCTAAHQRPVGAVGRPEEDRHITS